MKKRSNLGLCSVLTVSFWLATVASAAEVTIGIVTDGPPAREGISWAYLEQEVRDLVGREFEVSFPEAKRRDGSWTLDGVRRALRESLDDPEVDIIVSLGLMPTQEAARLPLNKPVIGAFVLDAELQEFPLHNDVSGKRNFVYISSFRSVADEIRVFRDVVAFEHVAVLIDETYLEAVPASGRVANALMEQYGARLTNIPVSDDVDAMLAAIPEDADAVYVTPLIRITTEQLRDLSRGLIDKKLPSFSMIGGREVEEGLLMTTGGGLATHDPRFARRIALNIQRILLGDDPAGISVAFPVEQRITINMRTARAIGVSPRFAVLSDAEQLYEEEEAGRRLTLAEAILEAVRANLNLRDVEIGVDIAGDDVIGARSPLLPQASIGVTRTRFDTDAQNAFQPEQSSDADVAADQIIYSDSAWAGFQISRYLETSANYELQAATLDTMQIAADAYLTVLRAKAREQVFRSNLEVTRTNLELARIRESIGFSSRADVLRWETEMAKDRQSVLFAEAGRRQAIIELNRVLDEPIGQLVSTDEASLQEPLDTVDDPRMQSFVDNPVAWQVFQEFQVERALEQAPELKNADTLILAQQRQITSARRSYYVPEIALQGSYNNNINRGGAFDPNTVGFLADKSWQLGLQARLPLYFGGSRRAEVSRSRNELRSLQTQRAFASDIVEARMRAALQEAAASYPSIELADDAARAATENLDLVTDSYSQGVATVTDLADAQDNALVAVLDAAEARYVFLQDFVEIQRSASDFGLFLDPASKDQWFDQIEAYFRERGVQPQRQTR